MKRLITALTLVLSLSATAQDFAIEQDVHPYYDILELNECKLGVANICRMFDQKDEILVIDKFESSKECFNWVSRLWKLEGYSPQYPFFQHIFPRTVGLKNYDILG